MSKKYLQYNGQPMPHIGAMLRKVIKGAQLNMRIVGGRTERTNATMVALGKNASIQAGILWEMCHALRHNFFADIAGALPADYTTDLPPDSELARLREELATLRIQKQALEDVLRK